MKNQQDLFQEHPGTGARRRRREKMLEAGDIRLLILHFIARGSGHGYELIKSIEELSRGEYAPSPGLIYPNLALLEEMECIEVSDPLAKRKAYCLTAEGKRQLEENQTVLTGIIRRLASMAVLVKNRSLPEVERAICNMKMALHARLSQADIPQRTLFEIIDALDEAARKIERS